MTATAHPTIPLFPLSTVLFMDGMLPLRIFEPRYVDMIGRCVREGTGFGVVLIRHGTEARVSPDSGTPEICDLGTYAEITDFNPLPNGMLGIVATGRRKFQVLGTEERDDHLLLGQVAWFPDEQPQALPEQYRPLSELLVRLLDHPVVKKMHAQLNLRVDLDDARSVSHRLSELLPVEPGVKQGLLRLGSPAERLAELERLVERLQ